MQRGTAHTQSAPLLALPRPLNLFPPRRQIDPLTGVGGGGAPPRSPTKSPPARARSPVKSPTGPALPPELERLHSTMRRRHAQKPQDKHARSTPLLPRRGSVIKAEMESPRTVVRREQQRPRDVPWDVECWLRRARKLVRKKVSESDKEHYRRIFQLIDLDGSYSIEVDELRDAMRSIGLHVTNRELVDKMKTVDVNYDGEITYDEYARARARSCSESRAAAVCSPRSVQVRHRPGGAQRVGPASGEQAAAAAGFSAPPRGQRCDGWACGGARRLRVRGAAGR
jgi:hypothetical protein